MPPDPTLSITDLFGGLSTRSLQSVLKRGRWQLRRAGSYFFREGAPTSTCYLLNNGRVRITHDRAGRRRVCVRFVAPGETFGHCSLSGLSKYPFSAEAVQDSRALAWEGEAMIRLMRTRPQLALNMLGTTIGWLRNLEEHCRDLSSTTAEWRIARSLITLSRQIGNIRDATVVISGGFGQRDLADMAGTTIYTASRALSNWERRGMIEKGRGRIVIHDLARFATLAQAPAPPR